MDRKISSPGARESRSLDRDGLEAAVALAAAAPSIMNSQPWQFHAHDDVIDVSVRAGNTPDRLDPTGREVHLSLGAALFNLRLAIAAAGWVPILQLLPDPYDRVLVARVRIGGPGRLTPLELPLYRAITARRSSRVPFDDTPVPMEDLVHLQEDAAVEGCHLEVATGMYRAAVVEASHEAERQQIGDPRLVAEAATWTTSRVDPAVGIPTESLGPRADDPSAVTRDLAFGQHVDDRPSASFESAALLVVLVTTGDAPINWLRGGMALERVLLSATARGLSVGLLTQSTQFSDLRLMLRDPMSAWHYPQIALRIGYGEPMPPTPRRPVADILVVS